MKILWLKFLIGYILINFMYLFCNNYFTKQRIAWDSKVSPLKKKLKSELYERGEGRRLCKRDDFLNLFKKSYLLQSSGE